MNQPAPLQSLWDSCAHLPTEKRALIRRLASLGVSSQALIAALAVVQILWFERYVQLPFRSISHVTGQPTTDVRHAIDELLAAGAIEHQVYQRPIARVNYYRLSMPGDANSFCHPE
ncbi:hypothetical protein [Paraburkholderia adhaesiva]|uniref:hypothetical protein n=1 Tax=Paraburkholderia adhaesiva TaxID=2883244 RepID=UPI001F2A8431|nr:hypothetical protein [Paraburkholderia adhaesiva]